MSVDNPHDERDNLAAELALGLLDGDELARARQAYYGDPELREAVARWQGRLAALADEVPSAEPRPRVWSAIERRLGHGAANDNPGRVHAWRAAALSAGALAAALAIALILRPEAAQLPVPQVQDPGRPLVATLSTPENASQLVATWDPASKRLFVAPDDELRADSTHSHELWIIPSDGRPRSLGTLQAQSQTVSIPDEVASQFGTGATLAISVEPVGGSTTGLPTGPVIATGTLQNL